MKLRGGFVVVVLAGCFSGSRMGAADVRQDGDLPCFSVAPAEMRAVPGLRLNAMIVSG